MDGVVRWRVWRELLVSLPPIKLPFSSTSRPPAPGLADRRAITAEQFGALALPVAEFLAVEHGTAYLGYSAQASKHARCVWGRGQACTGVGGLGWGAWAGPQASAACSMARSAAQPVVHAASGAPSRHPFFASANRSGGPAKGDIQVGACWAVFWLLFLSAGPRLGRLPRPSPAALPQHACPALEPCSRLLCYSHVASNPPQLFTVRKDTRLRELLEKVGGSSTAGRERRALTCSHAPAVHRAGWAWLGSKSAAPRPHPPLSLPTSTFTAWCEPGWQPPAAGSSAAAHPSPACQALPPPLPPPPLHNALKLTALSPSPPPHPNPCAPAVCGGS